MRKLKTLFLAGLCSVGILSAQTYDVLFIVDMNEVADPFTTPEVNGTFNVWCGGCAPMSDDNGDNIWELTIPLDAGTYEYKFAYDTWTGQESLTPGDECTLTTDIFTNRLLVVSEDMELDTVCWGSCDACEDVLPSYTVTFRVDMSQVTDTYTTPEVNGTFNDWCGGCAPMADDDADDIWVLDIVLEQGSYEYKFAYDAWTGQEELTEGDACTITTDAFTNRALDVSSDTVLTAVCWGSCDECVTIPEAIENVTSNLSVFPNPASEQIFISGLPASGIVQLFNSLGQPVRTEQITSVSGSISVVGLSAGVYTIQVQDQDGQIQSSIILIR